MLTCADVCDQDYQDLWIGMPGCHDSRTVKERKARVLNEANTEITTRKNKIVLVNWQYKVKNNHSDPQDYFDKFQAFIRKFSLPADDSISD
jgi:hypothetical protein